MHESKNYHWEVRTQAKKAGLTTEESIVIIMDRDNHLRIFTLVYDSIGGIVYYKPVRFQRPPRKEVWRNK